MSAGVTGVLITAACMCTILNLCSGTITSTKILQKLDSSPQWVSLAHEPSDAFRIAQNILSTGRYRRDTPKKLDVSQFDLKNDTTHNQALIHWSGENSTVVFILTRKKSGSGGSRVTESTLWRSTDYGTTYLPMGKKFDENTVLKSYFVCPSNKRKVIFVDAFNSSRRIWVSVNEGETYKSISVPFSVEKIEFHPEESDWLLGYDKVIRTLHCSMDFGSSWHKLNDDVTSGRYYWYVKGQDIGKDANKIVHFEYRDITLLPHRVYTVKSCFIPKCEDSPFQQHIAKLKSIDMDSLVVQDAYVFVQKSGAVNKLHVSHKRGAFVKAEFPIYPGRAQAHFHVVSSDGDCVVLGVNHDNGLTHLFFSNLRGDVYSQSLSNVRYYNRKVSDNKVYTVDIHEVQGLVGTYLANVHQSDGMGYNITKITWNNGRTWSDLKNVYDSNSEKFAGCSDCQLNLHLSMDQTKSGYYMPSLISKKSVPGLIIAHGTYGSTVEDNPNQVLMFISDDNGKSWRATRLQRHLVVVANHGAIIVGIKMIFLKPVKTLDFSDDYGRTWTTLEFTKESVNVDGILTEPGENTHYLTIFGHKTYADSWRIFKLDMRPAFEKACAYPGDFVNITLPSQVSSGKCHLGLIQETERLKPNTHCLIDPMYKRKTTRKVCNCTAEDYECDIGYEYVSQKGIESCVKERNGLIDNVGADDIISLSANMENCVNGKRNITTGFRKIPGDKCMNELAKKLWSVGSCSDTAVTTTTAPEMIEIQLVNKTSNAKMGENLMFSIKGTGTDLVWNIINPVLPSKQVRNKTRLTLAPARPGKYQVQASGGNRLSNMIIVEFWYPIEKVYLYNPPVVTRNKAYNATARTQTMFGLPGDQTLLGEVRYTWNMEKEQTFSRKDQLVVNISRFNHASSVEIKVTAANVVSQQTQSGKCRVKDFVETLVLEMQCQPEINAGNRTGIWLEEFRDELRISLFRMQELKQVIDDNRLVHEINLFVYVPPAETLKAYIYIAPHDKSETKEHLLKVILEIEKTIAANDLRILLARSITVTVKRHYVIDHNGSTLLLATEDSGHNAGVIAVVVIVVLIIIVAAFFVIRRVTRKMRFDRYLHFRNLRGSSGGAQHIVRSQDRSPIVDDEFIDDDLDTMEGIGTQEGRLQF